MEPSQKMNGKFAILLNRAKQFSVELRRELETEYPGCKFVYAAGAVEGMSRGQAINWREAASVRFAPEVILLNPMRHPKDNDTVAREIADILASDGVLIELNQNRIYIGTIKENFIAVMEGKPVVVWSNLNRVKSDMWLSGEFAPQAICDTLEASVDKLKEILGVKKQRTTKKVRSIVVSGHASSGKSTLAKKLADQLGLPFRDGGDALKELAMLKGFEVGGKDWWDTPAGLEFLSLRETDPQFDHDVDAIMKRYADEGAVMTSWTMPWIHEGPINVWLDTADEERIKRLAGRDGINLTKAAEIIHKRDVKNHDHYHKLYNFRFGQDLTPFHIHANGNASVDEIFHEVLAAIDLIGA